MGCLGIWRMALLLLGQRRTTTLSLATPSPASKLPSLGLQDSYSKTLELRGIKKTLDTFMPSLF